MYSLWGGALSLHTGKVRTDLIKARKPWHSACAAAR
jgi:hypothetical protein